MSTETPGDDAAPEKHEVTITVSGVPGTGRVAMALKIMFALRAHGIEVADLVNEEGPAILSSEDVDEVLDHTAYKAKVRVRLEAVYRNGAKVLDE